MVIFTLTIENFQNHFFLYKKGNFFIFDLPQMSISTLLLFGEHLGSIVPRLVWKQGA